MRSNQIFCRQNKRQNVGDAAAVDTDYDSADRAKLLFGTNDQGVVDDLRGFRTTAINDQVDAAKILSQVGRTEHSFTEVGEDDKIVHVLTGDIDGPLSVIQDDIGVKAHSAYRFRCHDTDDPYHESVEVVDLVRLEEQVLFGIQYVRGKWNRLLGSFDSEFNLNCLWQIRIIAHLVDDPCCD